ncbi:MAG: DNA starvation/stationary phase protection protein [Treponema phagedenis]|uniref:Dps family protein n=1 Tax=Treponema phagedenis TaxID=162 RepID=UPI0031341A58
MTLIERLAKHVADFNVLYTKLHNYHWHIGGMEFMPIHEMTEAYYEEITGHYDAVAERILQLGGLAPASLQEYLALTGIKEETKKAFTPKDVLTAVKADFEYLTKELHETRNQAADASDAATDSLLTDIIAGFEKKIWMLNASLK